ncbi:unnamed protein product, partial [Symbiodinium sp. CCMP2456]
LLNLGSWLRRSTEIHDFRPGHLGSWFLGPGCLEVQFFNADLHATRCMEPRSNIQESWASWFLMLGSVGLVAFKFNFSMPVSMQTGRWKSSDCY